MEPETEQRSLDRVERSLLGSLMVVSAEATRGVVRAGLRAAEFSTEKHALIFEAIVRVANTGADPDLVLVWHDLEATGNMKRVGQPSEISALVDALPDPENAPYYAQIVREQAALRRAMKRRR